MILNTFPVDRLKILNKGIAYIRKKPIYGLVLCVILFCSQKRNLPTRTSERFGERLFASRVPVGLSFNCNTIATHGFRLSSKKLVYYVSFRKRTKQSAQFTQTIFELKLPPPPRKSPRAIHRFVAFFL